ncbi:copper resistance protein CopC [Corynebacterium sp.]|uniref:copper resistance CopC family protein n=1 Tax=Corynebacterium sp. TaxID=1720 RepID=UPI002A919B81|nr:copper resistance protein CopC [Corynebacterium sp.]MDY5785749.1 copper resistance protein CopC [Corynebacterium sp.]
MPPHLSTPLTFAATAAVSALLVVGTGVPQALAHDAVVGARPADGEVVQEFPSTIALTFSGEVQDGFNTFAVSSADSGEVVYSGEPYLDGRDVILEVPDDLEPAPGAYQVGFQIISSDGHATKGVTSFSFQPAESTAQESAVAPTASEPASPAVPAESTDNTNASPSTWVTWLSVGAGVVIVAAAAIAALGKRGRNAGPADPAGSSEQVRR